MTGGDGLDALVARHGGGRVARFGVHEDAAELAGAGTVVCTEWPPGGREAGHRRLLARLRRLMGDPGVLIVEQPPPAPAVAAAYRPVTGLAGEVRLYHPPELAALVRAAGFAVEHVETAGPPGAPVPGVRLVARALPVPPAALAVTAWGAEVPGVRLDLRYADDEAEWIDPSPAKVWADLASTGAFDVETAEHYPVDDPFGGRRGAGVVSRFFGCPVAADRLSFGAGVTGLLRDLAGLAEGGRLLAPALAHPDLPAWAMRQGATAGLLPEPATGLLDEVARARPDLLLLDQPAFSGRPYPVAEIVALSRAVPAVVVDESAAPTLGPGGSAIAALPDAGNLVVLRGFTKAYSWGGLRAGFAVASAGLADRVRELVAPMQIGEPALRAALGMLAAGDVLEPLRARIRAVKPEFARRLAAAGLVVVPGHPDIGWVVILDPGGSAGRLLAERGIRGLAPAPVPGAATAGERVLRLTVPLSDRRIALFGELLGS